jgi:hypothetical protein
MLAIVATLLVFDAIDTSKPRYFNLAFVALMAGDIPLSRGLPTLSELESSSFGRLGQAADWSCYGAGEYVVSNEVGDPYQVPVVSGDVLIVSPVNPFR